MYELNEMIEWIMQLHAVYIDFTSDNGYLKYLKIT